MQIIQQTDEEKMAMYMKLPKKEIIAMLIQCNKILDSRMVVNENFVQTNVSGSVCNYCKGKGKIFYWEFGQFVQCGICQTDR